jgi:3-hydroxy-3-methylglutaryl CoA synthase
MTTYSPVFFRDMAERAIATYVQAFLGLLIASTTLDIRVIQSAAVAAIPAALSVVKSVLAEKYVPGTVSPASLAGR